MKSSNGNRNQGKKDKNDLRTKNSTLENSKKTTTKYLSNSITKNSNTIKESANINSNNQMSPAFRKKIERIDELRKEIKEDYIRASQRRNVISKWREVIQILQTLDIKLLLIAIKVLGDIYMEFDDYENARTLFVFIKLFHLD